MLPLFIFNPIAVIISFTTMFGVVVHDTQFDRLTVRMLAPPAVVLSAGLASAPVQPNDPHTHVERVSGSKLMRSLLASNPRIQPRNNEEKKHMMQKHAGRGHRPFDNYNLPVLG